jgi:acetolactate synthase I/II/III large subunit
MSEFDDTRGPESSRRPTTGEAWDLTVAEICREVLRDHGISTIFELPGGPVMPLLVVLHADPYFRCILTATEAGAMLAADGHYRATGKPAAVVPTAGPGVLNTAPASALLLREQSAALIVSPQVPRIHRGRGAAQEFDTVAALAPVTKASVTLEHPDRAADTLSELIVLASSDRPGPVHLSVAADDWLKRTRKRNTYRPLPELRAFDEHGVRDAAAALASAERPVVLLGQGAVRSRAAEAALALSSMLPRARFVCTPRAKGLFPENHARSLGVFGFAGSDAALDAVARCDLLTVVGSRLGEITTAGFNPALDGKRLIQIDTHAPELGRAYPAAHRLLGDARRLLVALTRELASSRTTEGALRETA